MTMEEIIQELLKDGEEYMVMREELIPVGLEPVKKHKKKRIQKKWIKRYGLKQKYEKKMSKVIDVTWDIIIDFCAKKGLPLPQEIISLMGGHDHE